GEIRLDGVRIDGLPPERRGFGMVFQNYALFPHLTVGANVAFGLVLRGRGKAEIAERVRRMLELVRLTGFADRYPGQLSGGQQQRVAIARALAVEPRVLLLDEPLSNLDTKLRLEMRGEIKRLHADLGLTSIYVTHDQAELGACSSWCGSPASRIATRASSRAASSSASPSPARSPSSPGCSSSTSRCRTWTPSSGSRCGVRSSVCTPTSGSRRST